jgi:heme-degrading monooxygenase HmoA
MAVMVIANDPTGTPEVAMKYKALLEDKLRTAPGFVVQVTGPADGGGYQIVTVWDSQEDFQHWFENHVRPVLPAEAQSGPPPRIHQLDTVTVRQ